MRDMLRHVLRAIDQSCAVSDIAVISPGTDDLALPPGVEHITQYWTGLNNLLEQGRMWAEAEEADAMMVIFADLPLLTLDDIEDITKLARRSGTVVLAPDRHEVGTNILLAHPPSAARFAFGTSSYAAHRALHRAAGVYVETYRSRGTSVDIDTPDDLELLDGLAVSMPEPEFAGLEYEA